jgi:DegV family protein with EDD domain
MKVKIVADSTCDLSKQLIDKYDIDIIPLYVVCNQQSFRDGLDISPDEIQSYYEKTGRTPTTASVSVSDFERLFSGYSGQGRDIIYISISSEMSSCYNNARIASGSFPELNIHCVDSRNLCAGIGLSVLRAAELAKDGASAGEIVNELERILPLVRASFMINTLDFLRCGGRCSSVAALGANLLKLRPSIAVNGGKMNTGVKFRGDLLSCSLKYINHVFDNMKEHNRRRLVFAHTGHNREQIDAVRTLVRKRSDFEEMIEIEA